MLLFLTLFLTLISFVRASSFPKPSESSCDFYSSLEEQLKCHNESPYLLNYGMKYCNKFQARKNVWNGKLKQWVGPTTLCLQEELIRTPSYLKPCTMMADTAYASHPTCYMKTGFCDFEYSDKQRVMNVVAWADIQGDLGQSVAQALRVKSTCKLNLSDAFLHLVDFVFSYTRSLDVQTRLKAAEIVLATPTEPKSSGYYSQYMINVLQTGTDTLVAQPASKPNSGTVTGYSKASSIEDNFDRCTQGLGPKQFCNDFMKISPKAFSQGDKVQFIKMYQPILIERINSIHKKYIEPKNWK